MARDLDATFYEPIDVVILRPGTVVGPGAAPPTALVAARQPCAGLQLVYYEELRDGLRYTFADRVMVAHGPAWDDCAGDAERWEPTTHRVRAIDARFVLTIGLYDPREGQITLSENADRRRDLVEWLGIGGPAAEKQLAAQLQTSALAAHQLRRDLRHALTVAGDALPAVEGWARTCGHGDVLGDPTDRT